MRKLKPMWLWLLLVPVALIVLVFVVGTFLPSRYEADETLDLAFSPAETWSKLHDPTSFPMSASQCRSVELLPADHGRLVWSEKMSGSTMTIRETVSEEPTHFVRELQDSVVPFSSRAEFHLEPNGEGGTRLRCKNVIILESGTWHVPIFRVMLSLFGGAKASITSYVGSIQKASKG